MAITGITGAPGAGKSAATVQLILEAVTAGRKVYVDGIPDLVVSHEVIDSRKWHEPDEVEDGALIVIDEVQRVWRPAGAGSKIPPDIAALETHRHRGLDFIVITQHPSLVHVNVKRLWGRHIHLRDTGITGRWWYETNECGSPESCKNWPVKKPFKLPKQVFDRYKSATVHVKPAKTLPPAVLVGGFALVCLVALVWYAISRISGRVSTEETPPPAAAPATQPAPAPARQAPPAGPPRPILAVGPAVQAREPYAGFGVHLAGTYNRDGRLFSWFTITRAGKAVGVVDQVALGRAGYSVKLLAPCVAVLGFGSLERVAACDAPAPALPPPGAPSPGALEGQALAAAGGG